MASHELNGLWPVPREVRRFPGSLYIGTGVAGPHPQACVVDADHTFAGQLLSQRLHAPVQVTSPAGRVAVRLVVDADLPAARLLHPNQRVEAYTLAVDTQGITLVAASTEGLLRGVSTLLQLFRDEGDALLCPCLQITDWPHFRYRCASDWLLNAEINRWGYDWGDGVEAFCRRAERKLDFCFEHKINQVWFDGLGWSTDRTPRYADLMRHLNRYARQRGISLVFAGYGGGYGTSYQVSELYRCGYQGQVFLNRESYPDGPEYFCCGLPGAAGARRYGTCLTNDDLQDLKLREMEHFVATVQPGAMYLHDIDTGYLSESHEAWLMRCPKCRERFPSDEMADPRGQAGAVAAWFRKVCDRLSQIPPTSDYRPAEDLCLLFTSPVYTHFREPGQPEVWREEVEYFRVLSSLLGPAPQVQFGIREQFLEPDGSKRIAQLADALEAVGNGHGVYVISFCGGDNYLSDDLVNASCVFAHLFEGARSVCLSNGGVHEEPTQLLNARALWSGPESGYADQPADASQAQSLVDQVIAGTYRAASVFGSQGALHEACCHLWGPEAGEHMFRAYTCEPDGMRGPVSRVWWAITREVRRFRGDLNAHGWTWESLRELWQTRVQVTAEALEHAQKALQAREDPDLRWFVTCLGVGLRFARIVLAAVEVRCGEANAGTVLTASLEELEAYLSALPLSGRADILGGDPGCWQETLELLREVTSAS
ncbi:glycoside hydrolase family 20 zincin-like fold domain-containing protein [bacterium]|nr:glycoside hydrolase family 20 zincin-like fold domain-containing protein [bacterium]